MIDVHALRAEYRVAIAELPVRTRWRARGTEGLVVVDAEADWIDAVRDAADAGARALVIADPGAAASADVRRLAEEVDVPVIVERPLLRPDMASDVRATAGAHEPPRVIVIDGVAQPARRAVVTRDGIGWMRVLAGGDPSVVAGDASLALLDVGTDMPGTLCVTPTHHPGGSIRAQALGETILDLRIGGGVARLTATGRAGRLVAPTRFESSARVALRRALDAIEAEERPSDLFELAADAAVAEQLGVWASERPIT